MPMRSPMILGLMASLISAPVQATPVNATPSVPTTSTQPTSAAALTLQDLPPGFTELPANLKPQFVARLAPVKQLFTRANLPLENFFAFVNPQKLQLVMGFTSDIPNPIQQRLFDASIQRVQQPEFREQLLNQVKLGLQQYTGVQLLDYQILPQLATGNPQAGLSFAFDTQFGQPLRVDFGSFRRDSVGAFTAIVYLDKSQPAVSLKDVATKLDRRILQSATVNTRINNVPSEK